MTPLTMAGTMTSHGSTQSSPDMPSRLPRPHASQPCWSALSSRSTHGSWGPHKPTPPPLIRFDKFSKSKLNVEAQLLCVFRLMHSINPDCNFLNRGWWGWGGSVLCGPKILLRLLRAPEASVAHALVGATRHVAVGILSELRPIIVDLASRAVLDARVGQIAVHLSPSLVNYYSGHRLCALISVPWCLRMLSTFSIFSKVLFEDTSPHAEGARTDPPPRHTNEGTQTTA